VTASLAREAAARAVRLALAEGANTQASALAALFEAAAQEAAARGLEPGDVLVAHARAAAALTYNDTPDAALARETYKSFTLLGFSELSLLLATTPPRKPLSRPDAKEPSK
jgi:hypothetical protein